MSFEHVRAAFLAPVASASQRLLLLILADFADETGRCYPSQSTLANRASVTDRHVRAVLLELEAIGLLKIVRAAGGKRSCEYRLTLPQERNSIPEQHSTSIPEPYSTRNSSPEQRNRIPANRNGIPEQHSTDPKKIPREPKNADARAREGAPTAREWDPASGPIGNGADDESWQHETAPRPRNLPPVSSGPLPVKTPMSDAERQLEIERRRRQAVALYEQATAKPKRGGTDLD